ncbi:MAG TPA: hypothetical protein VGG65_04040, partial [Thermoanaerobaculia bacterium]
MKRVLLAATATILLAAAGARAEDGRFEKTIPFPRRGDATLDFTYQKCTVRSVEVRNYPSSDDIQKARTKDPDDHSWLWWE